MAGRTCCAGLVETDLAKDLVTRVKGIVGEETAAASYYVSALSKLTATF